MEPGYAASRCARHDTPGIVHPGRAERLGDALPTGRSRFLDSETGLTAEETE